MDYNFKEIEKRWQQYWIDHQTYKVTEDNSKPKYYVLDMFPTRRVLGYTWTSLVTSLRHLRSDTSGFRV